MTIVSLFCDTKSVPREIIMKCPLSADIQTNNTKSCTQCKFEIIQLQSSYLSYTETSSFHRLVSFPNGFLTRGCASRTCVVYPPGSTLSRVKKKKCHESVCSHTVASLSDCCVLVRLGYRTVLHLQFHVHDAVSTLAFTYPKRSKLFFWEMRVKSYQMGDTKMDLKTMNLDSGQIL